MAETTSQFLKDQLFTSLPDPDTSLVGKTCIVTGSNIGLGLEAARKYAVLGASTVILAVRNLAKGEEARQSILTSLKSNTATKSWVTQGTTGGDVKEADEAAERVKVWQLDLSSYKSVQDFAARCEKELDRLDVVLENAGIATQDWEMAEDNEATITVNVISTFLLMHLLLPLLQRTAKQHSTRPTLSITSSGVHFWTKIPERLSAPNGLFPALADRSLANLQERYMVSKLLEVFYVRAFTDAHPAESLPVTINFVDPGLCWSNLGGEKGGWGLHIMRLALARTTEYGSRTIAHAGLQGKETHGQFLASCQVRDVAKFVTSEEGVKLQAQVHGEVNAKLEKIRSGVTKV